MFIPALLFTTDSAYQPQHVNFQGQARLPPFQTAHAVMHTSTPAYVASLSEAWQSLKLSQVPQELGVHGADVKLRYWMLTSSTRPSFQFVQHVAFGGSPSARTVRLSSLGYEADGDAAPLREVSFSPTTAPETLK
jgi:hypothetical protein